MLDAVVLGWGITGQSVYRYLKKQGAKFAVCNSQEIEGLEEQIDIEEALELPVKECIVSPGFSDSHPWVFSFQQKGVPIISDIELGLRKRKSNMLAVTGTNGKTTVTLFLEHLLLRNGIPAKAVGNVGEPFLDHIDDVNKILVVEVSSYQIDRSYSAGFDAGVVLNISPDHLDRYSSYEAYAHSKCRLGELVRAEGVFYVREDIFLCYPEVLSYRNIQTYGWGEAASIQLSEDRICYKNIEYIYPVGYRDMGRYEMENVAAAYALASNVGVSADQVFSSWDSFRKPKHRLEFVADVDGVFYYNDSKATNVESVMRAVEALKGPIILIAGGVDKNAPYTPWIETFAGKVQTVIAMGEAANKLFSELGGHFEVLMVKSLEEAVQKATALAKPGMQVLLSPGCASFDMFQSYEERGNVFKKLVEQMQV